MGPEDRQARPTAVTVIGWIWIFLSGLSLAATLVGLVLYNALDNVSINLQQQGPSDLPGAVAGVAWLLEHYGRIAALQAVTAGAILFIAVSFLRLRPWARRALLVVQYLALAAVLVKTAWWWSLIPEAAGVAGVPALFLRLGRTVLISLVLLYGVPIGIMTYFVHGRSVRRGFENFSRPGAQPPPPDPPVSLPP